MTDDLRRFPASGSTEPALRWKRLEFVPPASRFRGHGIEGEIEFVDASCTATSLAVAACMRETGDGGVDKIGIDKIAADKIGTDMIEQVRPGLEHCARWTHANRSAIATFVQHSLNDTQGLEMDLSDLSFDRIVLHASSEHDDYFAVWCSCRSGTPIAFVSLADFAFLGDAENYW